VGVSKIKKIAKGTYQQLSFSLLAAIQPKICSCIHVQESGKDSVRPADVAMTLFHMYHIKFGWDHPLGGFFPKLQVVIFLKCLIVASFTAVPAHKTCFHPAISLTWAEPAVSPTLAYGCGGGRAGCTRHRALGTPFLLQVPFLSLVCTVLPGLIYSCRRKSFIIYCAVLSGSTWTNPVLA